MVYHACIILYKRSSISQMEVDSEGVAIGTSAEQGGAPTTPPKQKAKWSARGALARNEYGPLKYHRAN